MAERQGRHREQENALADAQRPRGNLHGLLTHVGNVPPNVWAYGARYVRAALAHLTGLHALARDRRARCYAASPF